MRPERTDTFDRIIHQYVRSRLAFDRVAQISFWTYSIDCHDLRKEHYYHIVRLHPTCRILSHFLYSENLQL